MANKPEHGDDHHGVDALDLRRLRYFITLAEELHFGRAAGSATDRPTALSRLIARIEADIGAQLLDRSRSQIRLFRPARYCSRAPARSSARSTKRLPRLPNLG